MLMKDGGKEQYMPKRNCVRTVDERKIHDKAVKMRKMTDGTLGTYLFHLLFIQSTENLLPLIQLLKFRGGG